ncbi:alpha/beta hydrolase [Dysgonomonas sp. Marseille-P4677]|uniref:serine aminopeptidase domain-containing protein n=1 Tax=Dysgonomonas sp. Marseille-P4677 TaxID=2364790 RepID=UPI001913C4F0|nr:alpha/beta hydrolase [Dysgonomonas sp. Marseille-P4677]MBK5721181.1 alpha/beta hydrolase [Dysgonomonas sp. Marseille-P4677]
MKHILLYLLLGIISLPTSAFIPEIKTIKLNDGEEITTRLCLPDTIAEAIVFCISGTGPSTYLTKRSTFNYYDELANGFCKNGLAFFTYNRRGCQDGENPPFFVDVDSSKYIKYTPLQEAEDIECMINSIMKDKRFNNSKIILYGISEGTITASLVAERKNVKTDAILLHGYAHDNMFDIIQWQNKGHGVLIMANSIFDKDNNKAINKEEYEDENKQISAYRSYLFQNLPFDSLDIVKNDLIDIHDIEKMRAPFHDELMKRVTDNDWLWIKSNYFNITPQWFKSHFELEPNKTRLLRLTIPIHVFHGEEDANVPIESVYDLQARFDMCNKTNLTIHTFKKHNHDLNFQDLLIHKKWSEGFEKIFSVAKNISKMAE